MMKDWEAKAARYRAEGDEDGALYEEGFGAYEEDKPRDRSQRRAWLDGWDDAAAYDSELTA